MRDNKNRPAQNRESLYIRVLLISNALMLLLVFLVFLLSGGAFLRDGEAGGPSGSELSGSPGADDTPVNIPEAGYIPLSDGGSLLMDASRLDASCAILVDLEDNRVLASCLADKKIYPASMTKIMTLLVAVENIDDLYARFTVTSGIIDDAVAAGASLAGFAPGYDVSMLDLLYGAAIRSGADATTSLAVAVAGSEEAFAVLMNEKAERLGLRSTRFVNASGLHDDNHYSTVREIAAITACALDNELVTELLSASSYTTSPNRYYPQGLTFSSVIFREGNNLSYGSLTLTSAKTGYTPEAGNCLASLAVSAEGKGYILVTADGTSRAKSFEDCAYAYAAFVE